MFELYPAIDIHEGRCVRLTQGDYATSQVYDESPANAAKRWQAAGATQLHVVDLDGAKAGFPVNQEAIVAICRAVTIPVQLGGGIRTHADVSLVRSLGVTRTIIGTKAVHEPTFVRDLVAAHGDAIIVGQPGEAYSYFQMELRRRHPDRVIFVVNLTNGPGYLYIPTPDAYARFRYQAWQTLLEVGALELITDEVSAAIARMPKIGMH